MKTKSYSHWKILPMIFIVFIMACASFASPATVPAQPSQPEATETPAEIESITPSEATATEPEQVTSEPATDIPTVASTVGPSCTVLQDLNVRPGPGTAYDPPSDVLRANTEFIPIAYNPVGYPGGTWVQVQDMAGKTKGWVSAGSDYVSCNIDLTTLDSVSVAPPIPKRPNAQSSNPSGTCGSGETYDCKVAFKDGFPMQFILLKDGQEIGGADGVQNVQFRVDQNGNTIYSTTENNAAYCMFGGDGPCSWILEDYVYKWGSGGPKIKAGDYKVNIDATVNTADGDFNFHWDADVTISLK